MISSILEEIILQPFDTLPNYWLFFILFPRKKSKPLTLLKVQLLIMKFYHLQTNVPSCHNVSFTQTLVVYIYACLLHNIFDYVL